MCYFLIVVQQPLIQINLQAFQICVELLPESDLVKFLQDGLVEMLTDTVGLR
jgi:hypothetical protein